MFDVPSELLCIVEIGVGAKHVSKSKVALYGKYLSFVGMVKPSSSSSLKMVVGILYAPPGKV